MLPVGKAGFDETIRFFTDAATAAWSTASVTGKAGPLLLTFQILCILCPLPLKIHWSSVMVPALSPVSRYEKSVEKVFVFAEFNKGKLPAA